MKIVFVQNQFSSAPAMKYGLPGGVAYYRQRRPGKYLDAEVTHAGKELMNLASPQEMLDKVEKIVKEHDIIVVKFLDNVWAVLAFLSWCKDYNKPLFVDFDDNVITTDGLAREKFAYPKGSDERHNLETLLKESTGIIVSVRELVDVYKKYNENIYVCPNFVDPDDWKLQSQRTSKLKIGWIASLSHTPDHKFMEPVYQRIVKKYPDVVFSFCGHMYIDMIEGVIPEKNYELNNGIGWWEGNPDNPLTYPMLLAHQGYDIGLAPLIKSEFNKSRSKVKWFEYSMIGVPTICSDYGPYEDLFKTDAIKCTTENDWVEAISFLIENKQARIDYAESARKHILRDYAYPNTIKSWDKVFRDAVGRGFQSRDNK